MDAAETPAPMHSSVARATPADQMVQCDACPTRFAPRKPWQHFCSPKCRRSWHEWTRPAAVREARELVRLILSDEADMTAWLPRARRLLGIK